MGGVTLGKDVIVGEGSVLDIDTSMGDRSQLGHRSTLYTGQAVPAGERWHGSPGRRRRCGLWRRSRPTPYRPWRRGWFAISQLISTIGLGRTLLVRLRSCWSSWRTRTWRPFWSHRSCAFTDWVFYADAIVYAALAVFGGTVVALALVTTRAGGGSTRAQARHGVSDVRAAACGGAGGGKDDQQSHADGSCSATARTS